MTLRTSTVVAVATSTLVLALVAPAAYARWTFHNDAVGESVVAPPGATRAETCDDQLRATAGFGRFQDVENGDDPETFEVPAQAFARVDYWVWKAPPGFTSFSSAFEEDGVVVFLDEEGDTHPATLVGSRTTAPRALLPHPVPAAGDPGVSDNFLFTTAPIRIGLTGVRPGDLLGLAPSSEGLNGFVTVRAVNCGLPVLDARANLLPASPGNVVRPHSTTDRLPVRIFGSRQLKVRHVTEVHLGEAAPVSTQPPRDLDGDGRLDRTYVFAQPETGIQCIDDGVRITGRTSDRVRFQVRSPVTTTGCAG